MSETAYRLFQFSSKINSIMTRSKLELATILAKLRGDDSDPAELAKEMSLLKLCYEIQKIEETQAEPLTKKEEEVVEELKAPPEATTKKQKHKHILSWLVDSSSDEDEN